MHEVSYDLEYGSNVLQAHEDAFRPGSRVLIVDDVLATGGTVAATAELVRRGGPRSSGVMVLMELLDLTRPSSGSRASTCARCCRSGPVAGREAGV